METKMRNLESYLTREFIIENDEVNKDQLIELGDWWWDLTWQQIRSEIKLTIESWEDRRMDLFEQLEEEKDPYGYRGLCRSDFI
jgi:hypothetical protein